MWETRFSIQTWWRISKVFASSGTSRGTSTFKRRTRLKPEKVPIIYSITLFCIILYQPLSFSAISIIWIISFIFYQTQTYSIKLNKILLNSIIFYRTQSHSIKHNCILSNSIIFNQTQSYSIKLNHIISNWIIIYQTHSYSIKLNHILSNSITFYQTQSYSIEFNHILSNSIIFYQTQSNSIKLSYSIKPNYFLSKLIIKHNQIILHLIKFYHLINYSTPS